MKDYLKPFLYVFSIVLASLLLLTMFNYFNIINGNLLDILKLIVVLVAFFIGGIMIGKKSEKKGWIKGIKLSLSIIFVFILLNLIFRLRIEFKDTIYYLILMVSSMFGSMVGINKKAS